jgi:hypothetical protein
MTQLRFLKSMWPVGPQVQHPLEQSIHPPPVMAYSVRKADNWETTDPIIVQESDIRLGVELAVASLELQGSLYSAKSASVMGGVVVCPR